MCVVIVDMHGREVASKSKEIVKNQHITNGTCDTKGQVI